MATTHYVSCSKQRRSVNIIPEGSKLEWRKEGDANEAQTRTRP